MEQQLTRIAVKIGSNVLTRRDGTLDVTRMSALVDQIAGLHKAGVEINRKVLADLAMNNPEAFKAIVDKVKNA